MLPYRSVIVSHTPQYQAVSTIGQERGFFVCSDNQEFRCAAATAFSQAGYFRSNGGPLIRLTWSSTITSTRLAIFTKGMPLFIP